MAVKQLAGFALGLASMFSLACGSGFDETEAVAEPPAASLEMVDLVGQMRDFAWTEQVDAAQTLLESERSLQDTLSPDWFLAVSWLGRGASFAERWDVAEEYAREAHDGSIGLLAQRALDADGQLPLALGAAIEVLGHAQEAGGDRAGGDGVRVGRDGAAVGVGARCAAGIHGRARQLAGAQGV